MSKQQMKQINLNEEYALSADELNIVLRRRQRNKKTNEFTDNYTNIGYYSNVASVLNRLNSEVVLSTIPEVNTLESLVNKTDEYLSKLHDNVREVVKELRK